MLHSIVNRSLHLVIACLCVAAAAPAFAQKPVLDVQANVSPRDILYFQGTVTPKDLCPEGQLKVRNELEVLVEYVEEDGAFRKLPTRVVPTADEAYHDGDLLEGEKLEGRKATLVEISGEELADDDDGKPFCVNGTVDMSGAQQFRIIARLRHQWAGTFPEVECFYDIAGPFPVEAGIARKRESHDLLSDVGRFLERSACEIGEGLVEVGDAAAGLLLADAANPVTILQALLLGEVQQQSGALGEALRFIGGASGAGASTPQIDQLLSGEVPEDGDDLTAALVRGLAQRYAPDLTSGGIVATDQPSETTAQVDVDALADEAIEHIEQELGGNLGLRNLRINVDSARAIVASQMPDLDGHGHLQPIIAYMLVDAALAAPWTDAVTALFEDESGSQFGIAAPAEAARNLARGEIDVQTFLQLCRFADPDSQVVTTGGIAGNTGVPGATGTEAAEALLPTSQLPAGWLTSDTHQIDVADLAQIVPGLEVGAHSISWSGIQVVQAKDEVVTVVGLETPEVSKALQLVQMLESATGGTQIGNILRLSTDPPLHAFQSGERTYLLQGEREAVTEVAQTLSSCTQGSPTVQVGGLASLLPGVAPAASGDEQPSEAPADASASEPDPTTQPPPPASETPEASTQADPASEGTDDCATAASSASSEAPEAVPLSDSGPLTKTYLCTGVADGRPVELEGTLPEGTERLGVYIEVQDAPPGTVLEMELFSDGFSLGRRMMSATGDRRTVVYFAPTGGFGEGTHWLEVSADDDLLARTIFSVE